MTTATRRGTSNQQGRYQRLAFAAIAGVAATMVAAAADGEGAPWCGCCVFVLLFGCGLGTRGNYRVI